MYTTTYSTGVSDKQISFIRSLLSDRLAALGMPDIESAAQAISLDTLTKTDASTLIERLKGMAKDPDDTMPAVVAQSARNGKGNRPGRCTTCGHNVPQDTGYYYLATTGKWGVHHANGACITTPAPAPVVVTEGIYLVAPDTIVLVYRTLNHRLAGKVWTGRSYQYRQGSVSLAATGRPITAAEAAAFGASTGVCIACAKELTDGRSTEVGYGPVCAKKYNWPWGK